MNIEDKIQGFKKLPAGWHFGEGIAAHPVAVGHAIALAREAAKLGYTNIDAFPGSDGEVMVCAHFGRHRLDLTCETDGTVFFWHGDGREEPAYEEGMSLPSVAIKLSEISRTGKK